MLHRKDDSMTNVSSIEEVRIVECEVYATVEEYKVAYLRDDGNFGYVFNKKTPGINVLEVKEGQRYRCAVTKKLGIVRSAVLL